MDAHPEIRQEQSGNQICLFSFSWLISFLPLTAAHSTATRLAVSKYAYTDTKLVKVLSTSSYHESGRVDRQARSVSAPSQDSDPLRSGRISRFRNQGQPFIGLLLSACSTKLNGHELIRRIGAQMGRTRLISDIAQFSTTSSWTALSTGGELADDLSTLV